MNIHKPIKVFLFVHTEKKKNNTERNTKSFFPNCIEKHYLCVRCRVEGEWNEFLKLTIAVKQWSRRSLLRHLNLNKCVIGDFMHNMTFG